MCLQRKKTNVKFKTDGKVSRGNWELQLLERRNVLKGCPRIGREETRKGTALWGIQTEFTAHWEKTAHTKEVCDLFNSYIASGDETILTSLVRVRSLAGFKHIKKYGKWYPNAELNYYSIIHKRLHNQKLYNCRLLQKNVRINCSVPQIHRVETQVCTFSKTKLYT